jgi:UDP-glucose 4-epimerase
VRLLVTGATGFIGGALAPALARANLEVIAATHTDGPVPGAARVAPLADFISGAASLQGLDAIIHLAGVAHVRAPAALHRRVNAELTLALAERARAAGVRRFVFASSAKALGERTTDTPFTDATPALPLSEYGRSKLAAEQGLQRLQGLECLALRLPLVHGAHAKGNFAALLRLADTPAPLPFAGLDNRRSLISLPSAVAALIAAATARDGATGVFCVCDRPALSTADIVTRLRAGLGRAPRLAPPGPLSLLSHVAVFRTLFESLELDDSRFRSAYGYGDRSDLDSGAALRDTAAEYARIRRAARTAP